EDGYHIWSQRYDREMADVFEVQDEIVASIVEALGATLVAASPRRPRRPTDNLQAYDLYLKGRYYWNQRSPTVFPLAIKHFEEAIALDPEFALAYSGLADCYSILRVYGWTPVEHTRPRAAEAVARALALEPDLPEARFSKALYTFYFDQHWRAARVDFEEALRATPESATFEAYYGLFLATEYRYAEARRHLERALDLDPHSSLIHFLAACSACTMGDAEGAVRHASRALALQPDALGPRWPQTVGLLMAGRNDEALAAGEQVIARTRAPIYIGVLGMVYGRLGRMADARALVTELREREGRGEYIVPAAWLSLALGLEDLPRVREALAGCVDGAVAPFSVVSTSRWLLDPLRTDAEIDALLDRLLDGAKPTASPL
ncbi:MAG TPA: tetratricopeptide repeat protein, partial [Vicinamibacterales bacterium]